MIEMATITRLRKLLTVLDEAVEVAGFPLSPIRFEAWDVKDDAHGPEKVRVGGGSILWDLDLIRGDVRAALKRSEADNRPPEAA